MRLRRAVEIDEVGMAVRPAREPSPTFRSADGVALQPPTALDARPTRRGSVEPADSVPNAGLVLASAERRVASPSRRQSAQAIVAEARAALDAMTTYEVARCTARSGSMATLLPEEDVVVAIRREPRAVRLTWTDGPNQGREVLYRSDEPNAPMHVKMANPALPRLTLPPDSPLVMRNSRHPVTEAGFDSIVEGLENAVKASPGIGHEAYAGLEAADGLAQPHHCLTRISRVRENGGGSTSTPHDPPAVAGAGDRRPNGELLERYLFRDVRPNLAELATERGVRRQCPLGSARAACSAGSPEGMRRPMRRRRLNDCHSGKLRTAGRSRIGMRCFAGSRLRLCNLVDRIPTWEIARRLKVDFCLRRQRRMTCMSGAISQTFRSHPRRASLTRS